VIFGTDTASVKMLSVMRKPFTKDHIARATDVCKDVGLYSEHHMLLGAPGETLETATETLSFMDSLDSPVFLDLGIQVYDNTELAKILATSSMATDECTPPIFVEPAVAEDLPSLIVDYCSTRPKMRTFIVKTDSRHEPSLPSARSFASCQMA
jgi:hypothetical protein